MNLKEMTIAQLHELLAQVDTEISTREATRKGSSEALLRAWHAAIVEVWADNTGVKMPYPQWKRGPSQGIIRHLGAAEKYALKFFLKKPRSIQIHVARVVVIECLYRWMVSVEMKMTMGIMSKHMVNIDVAVESQFPGYARGKLLPMVLRLRGTDRG